MKMTRKNFLKTGTILAGGMLIPSNKLLASMKELSSNFKMIRDNIGIYTERGGTMGFYADKDAMIVVDTEFPDSAKNFIDGIKKITDRKIDIVLNTHHHGDHTSGNIVFKDYTSMIVAHEKSKELQQKFYGNDPSKPQAYPNVTFADEWILDLGPEKIWAKHICSAHTGGDSIIHFQNSNVVHMGDLVFNRVYPYIDISGGASLNGWTKFLEKSLTMFDKDTLYIFGHSQNQDMCYGHANDLLVMKNYITALIDFVTSEIKTGKTKEQIAYASEIPGVKDVKEQRDGMRKMNLERAYEDLTKN